MNLIGVPTFVRKTPLRTPKQFFTKVNQTQSLNLMLKINTKINFPNIEKSVSKEDSSGE